LKYHFFLYKILYNMYSTGIQIYFKLIFILWKIFINPSHFFYFQSTIFYFLIVLIHMSFRFFTWSKIYLISLCLQQNEIYNCVTSKPQDSFISLYYVGNSGFGRGKEWTQQQPSLSLSLSLSLSRRSCLLGHVPRVERTCVRPQIAGQRPT